MLVTRKLAGSKKPPQTIYDVLRASTPDVWVDAAVSRLPELLIDHANCELKAASTALGFIYRYPEREFLAQRMSRLAREELRHYEQVRSILKDRDIPYRRLSASRYAGGLRDAVRSEEPYRLLDMLLIGALIEARSCERFAAVAPRLPKDLANFYTGLLASESRHFTHYLEHASAETGVSDGELQQRFDELQELEAGLITSSDPDFRFHSGVPLS